MATRVDAPPLFPFILNVNAIHNSKEMNNYVLKQFERGTYLQTTRFPLHPPTRVQESFYGNVVQTFSNSLIR